MSRDVFTFGDKYRTAMAITEQAEADAYFERCVEHTMRVFRKSRTEAEAIERANLGYFAAYYDHGTRARVEQLFHCAHPIFGAIAEKGPPTAEEAFALGEAAGEAAKAKRPPVWTAGPWRWSKDEAYPTTDLVGPNDESILQVYESHGGGHMPSDADAGLIAAAPTMLAALNAIYESCPADPDINPQWAQAWGLLLVAIAKAAGSEIPV